MFFRFCLDVCLSLGNIRLNQVHPVETAPIDNVLWTSVIALQNTNLVVDGMKIVSPANQVLRYSTTRPMDIHRNAGVEAAGKSNARSTPMMTSQPRASLANARNVARHFDRRFAVVLARRHAITALTWTRPAGDHPQWQWLPDGLVSILQLRYGLNAVHID